MSCVCDIVFIINWNVSFTVSGNFYRGSFGAASNPDRCGLNMNNSDIIGLNCLWFNDSANTVNEGLNFARDNDTTSLAFTN